MSDTLLDRPNKSATYRRRRSVAFLVVLSLLVALVGGGFALYRALFSAPDYSGQGTGSVVVQVNDGDTARDIGSTLLSHGVVKSVRAFTNAANADPRSRQIEPGYYQLRLHMSGRNALLLLLNPVSHLRGRVTLPEGIPITRVVDRLVKYTELKRADILEALGNPAVLGLPSYAQNRVEGFLFPATYDIDPGTGAVDALQQMTEKFSEEAAAIDLVGGAQKLGLTPYQVVIIASIVEAETPVDADRAKVARVVLNRLARGMPLQLDSTVNYIRTVRKGHLSDADISVQSLYNTYLHTGLPPTPIDSPGEKALLAALNPAQGNWLYFITIDKQGHSLFTNNYQAFLRAKAKAQRDGVY